MPIGGLEAVLEFDHLVYLDVQKTGSSTTRNFLKRFARGRIVDDRNHKPVAAKDPAKRYFISCREPLAQYISLYAFGCGLRPNWREGGERGAMYANLRRSGLASVYDGTVDGFAAWMDLTLDPAIGLSAFGGLDRHPLLEVVGLQSLRFLTLNLPTAEVPLAGLSSAMDVRDALAAHGLADVVLRTETLTDQLFEMCDGRYGDLLSAPEEARRYLTNHSVRNGSSNLGIRPEVLPADLLTRIQLREWLFFDYLGYDRYVVEAKHA